MILLITAYKSQWMYLSKCYLLYACTTAGCFSSVCFKFMEPGLSRGLGLIIFFFFYSIWKRCTRWAGQSCVESLTLPLKRDLCVKANPFCTYQWVRGHNKYAVLGVDILWGSLFSLYLFINFQRNGDVHNFVLCFSVLCLLSCVSCVPATVI